MGIIDKMFGKKSTPQGHQGDAHVHEGTPGSAHDPVCDMWVDPQHAPAKSTHEGQTVYFCAPGCKRAFDANPAKYLPRLKRA